MKRGELIEAPNTWINAVSPWPRHYQQQLYKVWFFWFIKISKPSSTCVRVWGFGQAGSPARSIVCMGTWLGWDSVGLSANKVVGYILFAQRGHFASQKGSRTCVDAVNYCFAEGVMAEALSVLEDILTDSSKAESETYWYQEEKDSHGTERQTIRNSYNIWLWISCSVSPNNDDAILYEFCWPIPQCGMIRHSIWPGFRLSVVLIIVELLGQG